MTIPRFLRAVCRFLFPFDHLYDKCFSVGSTVGQFLVVALRLIGRICVPRSFTQTLNEETAESFSSVSISCVLWVESSSSIRLSWSFNTFTLICISFKVNRAGLRGAH